jgi:hypothetical protein
MIYLLLSIKFSLTVWELSHLFDAVSCIFAIAFL